MTQLVRYREEVVRMLEEIGGMVCIWIPSRQVAVWVDNSKLERAEELEGRLDAHIQSSYDGAAELERRALQG